LSFYLRRFLVRKKILVDWLLVVWFNRV
jgi:hypothetical protein